MSDKMGDLEGRPLVSEFSDQWARIDAYEKRRDLDVAVPEHVQAVVDVAMAIYDEVWTVEGPDEGRIQGLYENLGRVGYAYREKEKTR